MVIGLTGLKGSGKDTVADYLVEHHGFTKVSFAGLLKESVAKLFDISLEDIERFKNDPYVRVSITGPNSSQLGPHIIEFRRRTFREFLQRYGTEAHREVFGDDFWVTQIRHKYPLFGPGGHYVFSDCRFDNEAIAIIEWGGQVYRVDRSYNLKGVDDHVSESGVNSDLVADTIINNGTLDELYEEVRLVIGL